MIKLILPEEKYWHSFQQGLQEFAKHPTPFDIREIENGLNFNNFVDYNKYCETNRAGIRLAPDHVAHTCLWLIKDEKFIGIFDIRHNLTEALKLCGGHIAYAIIPQERGKGFATNGLKLCCKYAHDVLGIDNALATCDTANIGSYKTMKKVMMEFGGLEAPSTIVDKRENKRIWIKTQPRPIQIRPLAVALIKKDNKVLAVKGFDDKKNETFYRLIGGEIEFGERGAETIKREFMEEFGFEPQNIKYLTTTENIFTFNGRPGHEIVLVYEADLPQDKKNQNKFYGLEENIKEQYAEFIAISVDTKIYPEGIL